MAHGRVDTMSVTVSERTSIRPITTDEVRDAVREATQTRTPLRVAGAGTWLDAGRPVHAPSMLDLSALTGILSYAPGDLTLTALAGTTLAEIDAATSEHGQWLPLDAPGNERSTLGATVATASCGPLAATVGAPRDLALAVESILGDGTAARGGGRVVKNVAGFDLVRLMTGAWGTLGVITEVTVRLRPRPEVETTVALELPEGVDPLVALLRRVRTAALVPLAVELIDETVSETIGLPRREVALVRLAGNADAVAAQRVELAGFAATQEVRAEAWNTFRRMEPSGASVVRFSQRPARLAPAWTLARRVVQDAGGGYRHATLERGVVRCVLTTPNTETLRKALQHTRAPRSDGSPGQAGEAPLRLTTIFERLPASEWDALARSPARDPLSRRAKQAFDPAGVLNPGILGEELS
jgi:glycolate oxidase FAD binding subunit